MPKLIAQYIKRFWPQVKLILLFLGVSASLALLLHFSGITNHFNQAWVDQYIRQQGSTGIIYFIVIIALATSLGLPRQAAAFAAGYAFAAWQGTLTIKLRYLIVSYNTTPLNTCQTDAS